jgi:hypothetical protein
MRRPVVFWKRLTKDWEHEILRPIIVSLISAVVLVSGSLVFTPVRRFLFPNDTRSDYPLLCTAEPVVEDTLSGKRLMVDFYVINNTDDEQTDVKLGEFLKGLEDTSPTINLHYHREIGEINPYADNNFNEDKADLEVKKIGSIVQVVPRRIGPRAIARVRIEVTGLPDPALKGITRGSHPSIPFDNLAPYERACYSR